MPYVVADAMPIIVNRRQLAVIAARMAVARPVATPKMVVVASKPGREATRTATMSNWAHSLVESGHRPDTTNPFNAPPE